ncbi:MAG: ATP-binding cassette domain-containing protein [Chitinivibrionales bacterium]|nr:ATP-binding cassette domain-containing protein [Chitinivibrionales bacterium]
MVQRAAVLIAQGKIFALYGEAGSGKSMLVKTILRNPDAKRYRCAQLNEIVNCLLKATVSGWR